MKKYLFNFILISFSFVICSIAPTLEKYFYKSSEAAFSIIFPIEYEIKLDENEEVKSAQISTANNGQLFFASYSIHFLEMSGHEELEEISLDAFNKELGSTILKQSDWKTNNKTGLQAEMINNEQNLIINYYVVIVDQVQYQFVVLAEQGSFNQQEADAFIESFKLYN